MAISCKVVAAVCVVVACVASLSQASGHDHKDYYAYPKYEYKYGVNDPHTGDKKEQSESRDGDHVSGYYSLVDADGHTRAVHYKADKHSGFTAQVTKDGQQPLAHSPLSFSASLGYGHGYAKISRAH